MTGSMIWALISLSVPAKMKLNRPHSVYRSVNGWKKTWLFAANGPVGHAIGPGGFINLQPEHLPAILVLYRFNEFVTAAIFGYHDRSFVFETGVCQRIVAQGPACSLGLVRNLYTAIVRFLLATL